VGAGAAAAAAGGGGAGPAGPGMARLVVEYGTPADAWDACTQVLTRTVRVTEAVPKGRGGKKAPARVIGEEAVPQRVFTPQEVRLLAGLAGLEVVGEYGDMSLDVPPVGGGGDRWVGVLVKKA